MANVKVCQGITGMNQCPRCHRPVGEYHFIGCEEARCQMSAKFRPINFPYLTGEEQWAIDKQLGILDWEGY